MDEEEFEAIFKKKKPKDLSNMSIDDLEEYIQILTDEIQRSKSTIKQKKKARSGADLVFK